MTEKELKEKPWDEIAAYVTNLEVQRDDALTRIKQHEDDRGALLDDHQAELRKVSDDAAKAQASFDKAASEITAAHEAALAAKASELKEAHALIETLGGTELGLKMAKEKKKADLLAAKEAMEAELAKLGINDGE